MKRISLVFGVFLLSIVCNAQDTLKIMHYNLLYYGKNIYECDNNSNNIDAKNESLKKIIEYVDPDIFSVNELDGEGDYPIENDAGYLLDNALNINGITKYRRTDFPEIFLANTVFYNYEKLTLNKHYPLSFYYSGYEKIFNVYQFYFNGEDLAQTNDTVFVSCVVAHLKSGSYNDAEEQRDFETQVIMNYLKNSEKPGNILLLGDLNVYSPTEKAFQNLINPEYSAYTFNDPVHQVGEWHNNDEYRLYHTQSTHTSGECYSTGGMDDRFDFILASDDIIDGTKKMQYIDNSYTTIGQDGNSFNGSLNTTANDSVPSAIAQALYTMSDHLPVYLELEVKQTATTLNLSNIYLIPESPDNNEEVSVSADLLDKKDTISELRINYGYSAGNYNQSEVMNPDKYSYTGTIPKHEVGTEIFFQVTGYNHLGESIISSSEYDYKVSAATAVEPILTFKNPVHVINPAKGVLRVTINHVKKQNIQVELIATRGNVCFEENIFMTGRGHYEFPINHLTDGLYIVKLTGTKGLVFTQKIVVQ